MNRDVIKMGVEVDQKTNLDLKEWSKREGRSKRQHAAILLRKLIEIRKEKPNELKALGLA